MVIPLPSSSVRMSLAVWAKCSDSCFIVSTICALRGFSTAIKPPVRYIFVALNHSVIGRLLTSSPLMSTILVLSSRPVVVLDKRRTKAAPIEFSSKELITAVGISAITLTFNSSTFTSVGLVPPPLSLLAMSSLAQPVIIVAIPIIRTARKM